MAPGGALGDEGFVVGWAARDTSGVASFDVQVSATGAPGRAWLTGIRATSEVLARQDGVGYAFRVRARDTKGNTGAWNVTSICEATPSLVAGGFGRVVTDGLEFRTGPGTSAAKLGTLDAGTIVAVTRGPVSADGSAWFEVTQPITEWSPVGFVERGVWIAARSSTVTHVTAYPGARTRPSWTPASSASTSAPAAARWAAPPRAAAARSFSPNGDDASDLIRLRWTNSVALDALSLKVYATSGAFLGSVSVPAVAAGTARTWEWNGRIGGTRVADGRYVLQLVGSSGAKTYSAPSARPVTTAQVAAYAVTVDTGRRSSAPRPRPPR